MSAELQDVALVEGRLAQVITINDMRCITFAVVGSEPCPTCGKPDRVSVNEGTPLWDQMVRPVSTCGRKP